MRGRPDKLPDRVHWIAPDADGAWWSYEHPPNRGDIGGYVNEVGRIAGLGEDPPPADWQLALERVQS